MAPVHVLPPDSAGYLARSHLALFRLSLPRPDSLFGPVVPWEILFGSGRLGSPTARFDTALVRGREAIDAEAARRHVMRLFGVRTVATDSVPESRRGLFNLSSKTADVTFDGSVQFQVSTTRQRNLACTAVQVQDVASGCAGGFKSPIIENAILLQSHGVFAQRMNLNFDFDSKRDYAAGQVINVYYQGLEDEKLRRIDVGTVQWIPPASRYFSATIPSNNFGVTATAVFGPVEVRGILAAQKGSVVANHVYTIGNGVLAPQDITKRDLDYEGQRFFWVVDPRNLTGFPALDILTAGSINVVPDSQPADVRIYRYVAGNQSSGASANYDGITATASNRFESVGPLRWRLLKRNIDYWIDPSGLWFTLKNALNPADYLAVSYGTRSGGRVGTLPTVDDSSRHDQLRLIYLPNRNAASPLFYYEMRQVYAIAGSSLVRTSVRVQLLVAGSERPDAAAGTFLSVLGLALPAEQAIFDFDNRIFPRLRDPGARDVIQDNLLVFPSAQPFSDPRLTPRERNDSLYVTPEYLLLSQGPPSKFQLRLQFDATGGSDRSTITLDGFQITEKSEKIDVGGRRLVRDRDYLIDYATGRVNFLDPNDLFGNGAAVVTASFEQRGLFAIAPTTIAGLSATWNLGLGKTISLSTLYQAEATGYTRPQIGYEAHASFLAGLTADLNFTTPWLTRFINGLVRKPSTAPSYLRFAGEVAISRPDPNRSGDAYLEQFEDDRSILIQASQNRWVPGSMPKSAAGLFNILPGGFDSAQKVQLGVQNLVQNSGQSGIAQYSPHDIDNTVALTQSKVPQYESVLWETLHADSAGGIVDHENRSHWTLPLGSQPRWGAMTTALSPTGLDLTRNDYFEFAVYQTRDTIVKQAGMRLVIDLGRVSEDALAIAPTNFHVLRAGETDRRFVAGDTVYTGRQYVGVGRLDTERNYFGAWSANTDDVGILGDRPDSLIGPNGVVVRQPALCADNLSATVIIYRWGDLGARCTRGNSNPDTEDLDGDNVLNAQGSSDDVFRYIFNPATDSAKYFVRQTRVFPDSAHLDSLHSATWTIYRIPLAAAQDTIGSPDMHLIKQMRMTFVAPTPPDGQEKVVFFALSRMRFSGASWVARAARPIAGLSGARAEPLGAVQIGSISTQDGFTDSLGGVHGYTPPPGIGDAAATTAVSSSQALQQINEKSLSVQATNLQPGQRAEAYIRQVAGAWNLLAYNQLRVWAHGGARLNQTPSEGWEDGRLRAYVKLGSDAYNFYMYSAPARTTSWDPEMLIDLKIWQDLRQQIENARLRNPNVPTGWETCGRVGDSTAWFACTTDGAYLVQIRDPQINPPNLFAVQELAAGIYYPGKTGAIIARAELWIDDIRVGLPVSKTGLVGGVSVHGQLADVATLDLSGSYQSGNFHQLGQAPSYQNVSTMAASSSLRVDRFLPTSWGLQIPAFIVSNHGWVDPELISGTDVQGASLDGLRRPRHDATQWSVSVRHPNRQNEAALSRVVLSPFSIAASGAVASNTAALSEVSTSTWSTTVAYALNLRRRALPLHLGRLTGGLPKWFRESTAGHGLSNAAFAPVPTLLAFSSTISHTMGEQQSYQLPVRTLADTILKPVTSEQFFWRNTAAMNWEPFTMLTLTSNWASTRDLREYPDSTTLARVANAQHKSLFGADVGVERDRAFTNTLTFAPHLSSWLTTSAQVASNFLLSRSLTSRNPVRIDGDTAGAYILPQTLNDSRQILYRVSIDTRTLARRIFGDSSGVTRALAQVQPILFSRTHTLESSFDLARFNPGLGYQLALGGFDSFLARNGEEAIYAADATATTVAATVDLPLGLAAQANYTRTVSDRYQHQVGPGFLKSTGTNESWPSGRFTWSETFAGGPILRVTAAAGMQRDRATSSSPFADGTGAEATSDTRRITPEMTLTLRNAAFFRLSGQFDRSNASYAGNLTQVEASTVMGNVVWSLRMPRFLSGQRRTLTTNLSVSLNSSSSCIQRTGDTTCAATYLLSRTEVRTGFTASLAHAIRTGLDFGYVHNAVKSLGQLTSITTFSAWVNIPLASLGM